MAERTHITDFMVIGVVKGGTTSLYDYLNQHPEVYLPPIKEINYFSASDIHPEHFFREYQLDVAIDLEKYFKKGMPEMRHIAHIEKEADYNRLFAPAKANQKKGDVSNSYMICPNSAQHIKEHNPNAKLVVVLRNPIGRAWSQYLMNLREAKSDAQDFIQELKQDAKAENPGWGSNHQYLELGKYDEQLARYFALFSKEQIHIIPFEAYKAKPEEVMKKLCVFLEVESSFQFELGGKKNTASLPRSKVINSLLVKSGLIKVLKGIVPRNIRQKAAGLIYSSKNLPTINAEQKAYLKDYYQEHVERLSTLTNIDFKKYWKEFDHA